MGTFDRKYTHDQIEAILFAYLDRKIGSQNECIKRAAAGQLETRDGRKVRPFDMNKFTLRDYIRRERRRRTGGSALEDPDGTLEGLRRRLIAVADGELTYWERQKAGKRDPEQLRQLARVMREAAAIPKPGENRPRAPGAGQTGKRTDHETEPGHGLAGSLLAAHRKTRSTPPPSSHTEPTRTDAGAARTSADTHTQDNHASPGSSTAIAPDSAALRRVV